MQWGLGLLLAVLAAVQLQVGLAEDDWTPGHQLHVHLIPHSHCDPGWLKTYQEYYRDHVGKILDNVVSELKEHPTRRFVWSEVSFFKLWWDSRDEAKKRDMAALIESGQLEFVGGGWVQNDEATASLDVIVNQITEGHEYLLKHFNIKPRIAWQVDPFGHSSLTPTVFSMVGYEALVINRIHHELKSTYKMHKHMEFIWRGSPSLAEDAEMFTHVLHTHYSAPEGFDWEEAARSPKINPMNIDARAKKLVSILKDRADAYLTDQLMVPWGDDFKFQQAQLQFTNMDQIIAYINGRPEFGIQMKYSTLSEYFDSLQASIAAQPAFFPVYYGDFFPYADNEESYWTGYYTTRPVLKGRHRETLSVLRSAEMLFALGRAEMSNVESDLPWNDYFEDLQKGRMDSGLIAHHDGVTGTARSRVVADYLKMLIKATNDGQNIMAMVSELLLAKDNSFPTFHISADYFDMQGGKVHPLLFHNSLGWSRNQFVRVRVNKRAIQITDSDGAAVPLQVNPIWEKDQIGLKLETEANMFEVVFNVEIGPLSLRTYFLSPTERYTEVSPYMVCMQNPPPIAREVISMSGANMLLENTFLKVEFNTQGYIKSVYDKTSGKQRKLELEYRQYATRKSGAYIFRSDKPAAPIESTDSRMHFIRGDLVHEAHLFRTGAHQVIRLYNSMDAEIGKRIEIVHYVLPSSSKSNTEFVTRYTTDLASGRDFYTDNALELRKRSYMPFRAKPESNYYPVQSIAAVRDTDQEFTVLVRQPQGVTINANGSLEIMLHRNLEQDDGRGLSEAVRDVAAQGITHWLTFDTIDAMNLRRRKLSLLLEYPVRMIVGSTDLSEEVYRNTYKLSYDPLEAELQQNVHLFSLRARDAESDDVILRLMHTFETGQHEFLSREATFNIGSHFAMNLKEPRETSLSLNGDPNASRPKYPAAKVEMANLSGKLVSGKSGKQNSDEEGVFLSQIALQNKKKGKEANKQNSNEEGVFLSHSALLNKKNDTMQVDVQTPGNGEPKRAKNGTKTGVEEKIKKKRASKKADIGDVLRDPPQAPARKLLQFEDNEGFMTTVRPVGITTALVKLEPKEASPRDQPPLHVPVRARDPIPNDPVTLPPTHASNPKTPSLTLAKPGNTVTPQQGTSSVTPRYASVTSATTATTSSNSIPAKEADPFLRSYISRVDIWLMILVTASGILLVLGVYLKLQTRRIRNPKLK